MVLYAYELDKVLFRIERAGFVVYSVLSVREYANYHCSCSTSSVTARGRCCARGTYIACQTPRGMYQ